jgi:hypothetical protein
MDTTVATLVMVVTTEGAVKSDRDCSHDHPSLTQFRKGPSAFNLFLHQE